MTLSNSKNEREKEMIEQKLLREAIEVLRKIGEGHEVVREDVASQIEKAHRLMENPKDLFLEVELQNGLTALVRKLEPSSSDKAARVLEIIEVVLLKPTA